MVILSVWLGRQCRGPAGAAAGPSVSAILSAAGSARTQFVGNFTGKLIRIHPSTDKTMPLLLRLLLLLLLLGYVQA